MFRSPRPGYRALRRGRVSLPGQCYSVTSVTAGRRPIFAELFPARAVVTGFRELEQQQICRTLAFVVMPDHVHWLVELDATPLDRVMQLFKSRSARRISTLPGGPTGRLAAWLLRSGRAYGGEPGCRGEIHHCESVARRAGGKNRGLPVLGLRVDAIGTARSGTHRVAAYAAPRDLTAWDGTGVAASRPLRRGLRRSYRVLPTASGRRCAARCRASACGALRA